MTVGEALAAALRLGLERLDATVLLAHHLRCRREWLLAHSDAALDIALQDRFLADCRRRADAVPLAYLTGRREFLGLDLRVTPAVLVPRPETEVLAQWAIERVEAMRTALPHARVVDLGTGSGALALAITSACPHAEVIATDASAQALEIARDNARRLGLSVHFAQGHWWEALGGRPVDLAVANPPYVAPDDPHLAALRHEPQAALVAAASGLAALRQLIEGATSHLAGWLLLEHGWDHGPAVRDLMRRSGFDCIETRPDLQGHARCTGGRLA